MLIMETASAKKEIFLKYRARLEKKSFQKCHQVQGQFYPPRAQNITSKVQESLAYEKYICMRITRHLHQPNYEEKEKERAFVTCG